MEKNVKSPGRKRKLRNMDDLVSLLTQVKERARNLETRVKNMEEFGPRSQCLQFSTLRDFVSSVGTEKSLQSITKDNVCKPLQNLYADLVTENQTVPILDEYQIPLFETDNMFTVENFQDWFESKTVDKL